MTFHEPNNLNQTPAQNRETFAAAPDKSFSNAFYALDREWKFVYLNQQAANLMRRSRADLIGKSVWDEFPEAVGTVIYDKFQQAFRESVTVSFEVFFPPLSTWFEASASGSADELSVYFRNINEPKRAERASLEARAELEQRVQERTAELEQVVGILQSEVHERRRIEAALHNEREFLRALLENIEDGIVACDARGVLTLFNRATLDFHGLPDEPLPPEQWTEHYNLYRADGETPLDKSEIPLFRAWQGERVRNAEMVIAPKTGAARNLLASGRAILDQHGNKLGAVVSMHDVTNERRAEQERREIEREREARRHAEESNRVKDEFLATLSHELRTPLNAILGWAQMLQTNNFGESETMRALATIERNARAQNKLIEDLLDISRIVTGKLRLDVRPVDLAEVIQAATEAARPAAAAKNINLQIKLDPTAELISGDADRLQQVVWNLLSNAIKFTNKDGAVEISLNRQPDSQIEIVVSDTGKGIEPDFVPFVFDRFRQSDGSMTRRHGGLGVGLAIVRQLVELHGGTVAVSSLGEGLGATFTVSFPSLSDSAVNNRKALTHARTKTQTSAAEDCAPELAGLRVLLVDDEADSRELLNLVLEGCGALVWSASSAAEALALLEAKKFDVIVSDIGMPEEDGFSLIGKIRNLSVDQGGALPAIALTAYARTEDRTQALRAGFQMHIAKPIDAQELVQAIANLAKQAN